MKKALSLVLTAVMLLGVLSVFTVLPVSATDWDGTFTTSSSGWNGTTATAPKGEGTKENPYLIANAENLLWVQKQVPTADRSSNPAAPAFKDMYLEQTADIDLNGKKLTSIGFYYSNAERMGAFAGTYNGNGFKIFNGTIGSYNGGHELNNNWGHGLFGIIYGATLKNITLEKVTVIGHGLTGALVGRAISTDTTGKTITNTIENCSVKDTIVDVNFPSGWAKNASYEDRSRAGGICGWVSGTEILYCSTENVDLLVPANFVHMGGIVGTTDDCVVVDHCIGDTDITIQYGDTGNTKTDGENKVAANTQQSGEAAMGGIVGFIPSNATDKGWNKNDYCTAGVTITNCINTGSGRIISTDITKGETLRAATGATYYGGILGGTNKLDKIDSDFTTRDYYIGHCYNLTPITIASVAPGTSGSNIRIAGIAASVFVGGDAKNDCDILYIEDSLSVDVESNSYSHCNEFVSRKNGTTSGYRSVYPLGVNSWLVSTNAQMAKGYELPADNSGNTYATRALGDFIYVPKADGTGYELSTTTTFQNVVDKLTKEIKLAQDFGKTVVALGYQKGLDGSSNEGAYRLVFGLHKLEYCNLGVTVAKTVEGGATTFASAKSDVVYTSVKAFGANGEKEITAEGEGVEYLTTLTLNDIPTEGTVTYVITTYVTNRDTAGTKTFGDVVTLKFVNGALDSATIG